MIPRVVGCIVGEIDPSLELIDELTGLDPPLVTALEVGRLAVDELRKLLAAIRTEKETT